MDSTTVKSRFSHLAGTPAAISATRAYLADCSDPATRSVFVPQSTEHNYKTYSIDHVYSPDFTGCCSSAWRSGQLWVPSLNVSTANPTWYSILRLAYMPSMPSSHGLLSPSPSYLHKWTRLGASEEEEAGVLGSAGYLVSFCPSRYSRLSHKRDMRIHRKPQRRRTGP
jgi:hypothetical protein